MTDLLFMIGLGLFVWLMSIDTLAIVDWYEYERDSTQEGSEG